MATFLEICQNVALESGTISTPETPASVVDQDGRLSKVVSWTVQAYNRIQLLHHDWLWLRGEFTGQTIAGVRAYDSAAMSIATRFSHWIKPCGSKSPMTYFLTASGQAEERRIKVMEWDDFYSKYRIGAAETETGAPSVVTIDPQQRLQFHPIPDSIYTIRGHYYKSPQVLASDAEVPEMPAQFHDMIKWKALMLLAQFDEGFEVMPHYKYNYDELETPLLNLQHPSMKIGGTLA